MKLRYTNLALKKGFTLIELLVVITIIGLMSTIVLSSLNKSRAKAYDSKIKQQLSLFRSAAEIFYTVQNPNGYYNGGGTLSACNTASTLFTDIVAADGSPGIYLLSNNLPVGTTVVCGADQSTYAVKATLYTGASYWCVDSTGKSKEVLGAIGSSATFCP